MRTFLAAAFAAVLTLAAAPEADAALTFSLTNTSGGDGSVVPTAGGFDIIGSNDGLGANAALYTFTAQDDDTVTFDYTYTTDDCCGSAFDPAGIYLDGAFQFLSPPSSAPGLVLSGSGQFREAPGGQFGFFVYSTDSLGGPADLAISNLQEAAVPLPATWLLLLVGFAGVGSMARQERRAEVRGA